MGIDLEEKLDDTKQKYRKAFLTESRIITNKIEYLKPTCADCVEFGTCRHAYEYENVDVEFPVACKVWVDRVRHYFSNKIMPRMKKDYEAVQYVRDKMNCSRCALCCNLAISEFSFEELKEKASKGDNFATQFLSVFIPYENELAPRELYPEYFELLDAKNEPYYCYHCPKVKENLCSDYDNRPEICREYPSNPLMLLPSCCGYSKWREKVEDTYLELQAKADIIEFYNLKINELEL